MSAQASGQVDVRAGTMRRFNFIWIRAVLYAIARLLTRMDVQGAQNVPREGGCIIVANHLHNLDPVLVSIACPRPLHYMAKAELFKVPVLRQLLHWTGNFPINRGKVDRTSIKRARATVEQGVALGIFPEGTRSTSMKIERVLPGAGLIATQGDVLVVPTAVTGTERLPFNGTKQRRGASMPDPGHKGVRIVFGEPFRIPAEIDGKRTNASAATDYMMKRVAAMLPAAYRGIYGPQHSQVIELDDAPPTTSG